MKMKTKKFPEGMNRESKMIPIGIKRQKEDSSNQQDGATTMVQIRKLPYTTAYSRTVRPPDWYGTDQLNQTKEAACDIILVNINNTLLSIIG